jgi:hypothetical protein
VLLVVAAGCGGGGGDDEQPPPPPTLIITTTTMPDGVVGQAYNQTVAATGGTGARTFSISAGSLPAGLALNTGTGAITGTPTGPAGTASFTVQVVDAGTPQQTDTQALTIDINDPLNITTAALPNATIGVAYSQTVAATGGSGALTFTISAGSLPAGLSMNAAGAITGTPTSAATTQTFTVRVADGSSPQQVDTQSLTIMVVLEITTTSLPSGNVGTAYSQTVMARGGRTPYTWAVTAGNLPAGLAINSSTGVIGGTPTTQETQAFTVRVTDADAQTDTQGLSITIIGPNLDRNDTIGTATPLSNGTFAASISPSGDPNTVLAPDQDFYQIIATAGAIVTVNINAQVNGSPLDSVIEIVDVNGVRLNVCSVSTGPPYNQPCVSDDEVLGVQLDSFLEMQVGATTTFFVHVVDFRGDARPDLLYDIVITGAN